MDPLDYQRVNDCPIDVYIASNMPYQYPYKLVKPAHVTEAVAESCETLIMDSGIRNDDVDNTEVLSLAHEYDADMVVAKDYLHDRKRTTASIREFLDAWADHQCRATPLIPLQPPHHEHYRQVPGQYHYLLGGMDFDTDAREIITAIQRFRDMAGSGPYVHLLGVGANARVMDYLSRNPGAVQSLDCSTPEQCAINGKMYGTDLQQRPYNHRTGEGSRASRSGLARHLALTLCDSITVRYREQQQGGQQTAADYGMI